MYRNFKNSPYHMGNYVEINKIQSSKSQTDSYRFKTIALKSRINLFFQITTIAHVSRRVFSFLPCLVF